ncbi:hypothetical protein [Paenibacillus tepidiphilus]|uniref:hypothetical protein n=1 Tax=Paenibacillus tepidiphilus TaxID=2608683 RepID=UPI001239125B|nr:hypothetical protein [Paenibacillus tepidiphilus]
MLDDTPRKLLRIIVQFHGHFKRMPTLPDLRRLSGRQPTEIFKGLKVLVADHYIDWDPARQIETAYILEGWERDAPFNNPQQQSIQNARNGKNIDYWLYY